jgi:hypothetical protein
MYNGLIIMSDLTKNNKERRMKIRIPVVINEIESRINKLPTVGRARSNKT